MAYDKLRPLRQQLDGASKLARSIPSVLPANARDPGRMYKKTPQILSGPAVTKMQRNPMYRVERRIYFWYSDNTRWFYSMADVETYVRSLIDGVRPQYSRADWPLSFEETTERGAWYLGGTITVPIPVQQMALLHELAHHLVGADAEHGPVFFEAYMGLVRAEIGEDVADRFVSEMASK